MNPTVIPHELLAPILARTVKGHSSRDTADWLWQHHGVRCSHMAVAGCIERATAEKAAMEELLAGETGTVPPGSPSEDRLVQLDRDMLRMARSAMAEGDRKLAFRARVAQIGIVRQQQSQQRHLDRLARQDKRDGFQPEAKPPPELPPQRSYREVLGEPETWREPTREEVAAQQAQLEKRWEEREREEERRLNAGRKG